MGGTKAQFTLTRYKAQLHDLFRFSQKFFWYMEQFSKHRYFPK
jgi:hypothetical protein